MGGHALYDGGLSRRLQWLLVVLQVELGELGFGGFVDWLERDIYMHM